MNIIGKITGIKYKILLSDELKEIGIKIFDINEMPTKMEKNYLFQII